MNEVLTSHKESSEALKADHKKQLITIEEKMKKRHEDEIQRGLFIT